MAKNTLEYSKKILIKVSFDIKLFRKELAKAYQYLMEHEVEELINWVKVNFGEQYCLKPIYVKK
ncbi:MAG: hypothetical protein J5I47_01190 [Vicingus serpentipes]|nr:hypothetical protein [Vicingus serpentipes]